MRLYSVCSPRHASYALDDHRETLISPENVGKEITISGKFSHRGRYGPYIQQTEQDDEWVYIQNADPRDPKYPKQNEGEMVTVTGLLQLSPGARCVKVGKRIKLVWTQGYKWTGKKNSAIQVEHYYFDARNMKIESVNSP